MKNGFLFFLGLFASMAASWFVLAYGAARQMDSVTPHFDTLEGLAYPQAMPGVDAQGMVAYRELGCAACHTQQVRRPGTGYDNQRGWGARQSVARDYLYVRQPVLGLSRQGPDLANFGERAAKNAQDKDKLLAYLYEGHRPAYRFLFEPVSGLHQALPKALTLTSGTTVLPTRRAEALVTYLLNLKQEYVYPEAQPPELPEAPAAK